MSASRTKGSSVIDDTLKLLGLSVLSGAMVGGLILSFFAPRRNEDAVEVRERKIVRNSIKPSDTGSLAIREGFSMAEAKAHSDKAAKDAKAKNPEDVFKDLQRGNARFWMGCATRPEVDAFNRRSLIMQQFPSVVILGCSDSRVPIEIIFDQGLGDVFVIRVAGNTVDESTMASLEYAVEHLEVKVLVVLGHEGCGAVRASMASDEDIQKHPPALAKVLGELKKGLCVDELCKIKDHRARDREAVVSNVRNQIGQLKNVDLFKNKIKDNKLIVTGAFYEISSGIVDFMLKNFEE